MSDKDVLLDKLPTNGAPTPNGQLRKLLRWGKAKYFAVQDELVTAGLARKSRGRGGRLERIVDQDAIRMLAKIPPDGSTIGNITLRKSLRWRADRYWAVRDGLLDSGVILKGGGMGGSVHRVIEEVDQEEIDDDSIETEEEVESEVEDEDRVIAGSQYSKETDLYPEIKHVLRTAWSSDQRIHKCVVEVTAHQGRKRTGGKWTRPDLTLIGLREYPLIARREVDVITFEVKLTGCWDVSAVYEAAAQSRAATHAYVFLHVDEADDADGLLRCQNECAKLNLGLITSTAPHRYDAWNLRLPAPRLNNDPEEVEAFLNTQVSAETLAKVKSWHLNASWTT